MGDIFARVPAVSADALVRRAVSAGHASASYAPAYGRHSLLSRSLIAPSQREPCPLQQNGGSTKRTSAGSPLHSKGADARTQARGARTGAREDHRFPQRKSSCALAPPPTLSTRVTRAPTVIPHSQRRRPAPDTLHAFCSTFGDRCDVEAHLATFGLLVHLAEPRRSTRSAAAVLPRLHGAIAVRGL